MKIMNCLISALVLILGMSSTTLAKDKKHPPQRGMLERMEAVPCGARQKGIAGVGSVFASAGVTHLNSDEKLCQQYLLRTDDMEYHIRPANAKHAPVLPVGREAVFKIKKDRLYLRMADEDRKARPFQVVAMKPLNSESDSATSAQRPSEKPPDSRPANKSVQPPPAKPANAENASGQNPGPGR
jgi:hypothetical protein